MATFETKDTGTKIETTPGQANTDNALTIHDLQIVSEQTSRLDVSEKPCVEAKEMYQEYDILSKKSLERVSPSKDNEEVIICLPYYHKQF